MSEYNFSALTKKQQHVLGMVSINLDGGHNRSTLDSLVKKGLIERYEEPSMAGPFKMSIHRYRVPLAVHMAWCYWCAAKHGEHHS